MGKCTTPRANTLASLAELGLAELNTYDNRYRITDKGKEVAQTL
jgi:predicted transcriptional regulator